MFVEFKRQMLSHFESMKNLKLFRVKLNHRDELWDLYLESFSPQDNPVYKERTEHDCNCCKSFIRNFGAVVGVNEAGERVGIWDFEARGPYKVVVQNLSDMVKERMIDSPYQNDSKRVGTDYNFSETEDGEVKKWNHFSVDVSQEYVRSRDMFGEFAGRQLQKYQLLKRGYDDISFDSLDIVLDLIAQNSLYRGNEFKHMLVEFKKYKKKYENENSSAVKDAILWHSSNQLNDNVCGLKNTAIGSLLLDLTEGRNLEQAVKSYEDKVAPTNYRRSKPIFTKQMLENAKKKIEELGFLDSLARRHAQIDDITINNVLFANRDIKEILEPTVFDMLEKDAISKTPKYDKVEEVNISTFISEILPTAKSLELLIENKHENNFMSLIAPVHCDAKTMFKWGNNFSWSYNGGVADSIKERVKNAGGNVTGDLRCSLSWFNYDDLDLHLIEPNGHEICFRSKMSRTSGGNLDVDMNAGGSHSRSAVENICFPSKNKMLEGVYSLFVHNYSKRENKDVGFDVEIEFDGELYQFSYQDVVGNNQKVEVAKFQFSKKEGLKFISSLPAKNRKKEVWNLSTQEFHPVSTVMLSPNYWDGNKTGNKHFFFILKDCKTDERLHGFYNEFLTEEVREHRKVFEALAGKMMVEPTENQLSGLGFSSTKRNSVIMKVTGSFTRTMKVNF